MISRGPGRGRLGLGIAAVVLLGPAGCGAPGAQQTGGADKVVTPERPTSPIARSPAGGAR